MPIDYDPLQTINAGFFALTPSTSPPLRDSDKQTLLRLLFWMTYEVDGRGFITANREPAFTEPQIRAAWLAKLTSSDFGILDTRLQDAIIDGHLAASRYVAAFKNPTDPNRTATMALQEKIYQQNLSFVCWTLWENSLSHEFSMNW